MVQLAPEGDHAFWGCFLLVTEVKPWGVQGFVCMPGERGRPPGAAYFRAKWDQFEYIGEAAWGPSQDTATEDKD